MADSASGGSFSLDSRFVVFTVSGQPHLFVQPVAGGPRRQVTSGEGSNSYPLWSPDGNAIAYQRPNGIWVVPVTNGAVSGAARRVLGQAEPASTPASWVTNGLYYTFYNISTVAYQLPVEPATARPAGPAQRLPAPENPFFEWVWSPEGRQTAFAAINGPITIQSEDGKSAATFSLGSEGATWNAWWSGDGNEVLYTASLQSRQGAGATILALDLKTGKVRTLLPRRPTASQMTMSTDGRRVAFTLGIRGESSTLVIIGPGRGDSVVVVEGGEPDSSLGPPKIQLRFPNELTRVKAGTLLTAEISDENGFGIQGTSLKNSIYLDFDRRSQPIETQFHCGTQNS